MDSAELVVVLHAITSIITLVFRITTLVVGYRITKLGYDLMVKGITGGFKFSGAYSGVKGDLISSSPGLLFLLLGVVLLCVGVINTVPIETVIEPVNLGGGNGS